MNEWTDWVSFLIYEIPWPNKTPAVHSSNKINSWDQFGYISAVCCWLICEAMLSDLFKLNVSQWMVPRLGRWGVWVLLAYFLLKTDAQFNLLFSCCLTSRGDFSSRKRDKPYGSGRFSIWLILMRGCKIFHVFPELLNILFQNLPLKYGIFLKLKLRRWMVWNKSAISIRNMSFE